MEIAMKTDSSITHGASYIQHFFETVCCEKSSAERVLSQLFPDGPKCASCGARITGRRALLTFWTGERTFCAGCGCKFSPRANTILDGSHLSFPQFEVICVLLSLGVDHKRVSSMTGVHADTVGIWHDRIKFWESHV